MAKILTGTVSSVSPDKTIVISVVTHRTHPIYKKQFVTSKKFMAHDENNECKVGDLVSIVETRPISARKRFKLSKVLEKAALTKEDLRAIEDEAGAEEKKAKEAETRETKDKTQKDSAKAQNSKPEASK